MTSKEHPDLVICDTDGIGTEIRDGKVYPNGYEFCSVIRENQGLYGNPKFIGMSNIRRNLDVWQSEYRANGVLKKPEDISRVYDLVDKVLTF